MNPAQNRFAIGIITVLCFLWSFALNLNPTLIPHLKKACQLSDAQSALIDSASYIAYFMVALPAGLFVRRYSYRAGITIQNAYRVPASCLLPILYFAVKNFAVKRVILTASH